MITYEGESFVKKKLLIKDGRTKGIIKIPEELISGYYYLKVYTRWKRNYSPQTFSYTPVKIINYKSNEFVNSPKSNYISDFKIDSSTVKYEDKLLSVDKETVNRGDEITVTINKIPENTSVAVIRVLPYAVYNNNILKIVSQENKNYFNFKYLPETRGVSLSGIIVGKKNKQPIANNQVNLSIIDTINYSFTTITDSAGKFYFDLGNIYKNKELLITVKEKGNPLEILVDNDFCNRQIKLPFIPFTINNNERDFYTEFINRGIVENSYIVIDSQKIQTEENYINLNYQKPDFKLILSDYISMSHLADYFHELIPNVGIRRKNNQSVFQVFGNISELQIYSPLVLIDNVIITNIDKLLQISPNNIYSIETFEKPYAIGNQLFGGVIRINSKDDDLAKIELPESGMFLNYKMLSANAVINYKRTTNKHIPLSGNTVFWDVISKENLTDKQKTTFTTSNIPGKYIIEVRMLKNYDYIVDTLSYIVK